MEREATTRFLRELRELGAGPVPEPSRELRALLDGARLSQRRGWESQRPARYWHLLRGYLSCAACKAASAADARGRFTRVDATVTVVVAVAATGFGLTLSPAYWLLIVPVAFWQSIRHAHRRGH